MRSSYFFSKLFLGLLFIPAVIFSSELTHFEGERNDIQTDLQMARHHLNSSHSKSNKAVFASYRNNTDQSILAGGNVLFNVKNANKGKGISYDSAKGIFKIHRSGFYLINYGIASIGNAGEVTVSFSFNLIKSNFKHHSQTLLDSVMANSSSALVLFLKAGDSITVVSRETVNLAAGSLPPRTTTSTDTSFISFLRVDR